MREERSEEKAYAQGWNGKGGGGIMETMTGDFYDMRCGQTGESKTERELKIAGREGQREGNVKISESIVASPCHTGQGKEKNHHNQGQPPPPRHREKGKKCHIPDGD